MRLLKSINWQTPSRYRFATNKSVKQKTLYQILEVPSNATPVTIKKNFLKLAKIYHPDVYKGADKTRFNKIQEAYKTLSNQKERIVYDEKIGLRKTSNQYQQPSASAQNGQASNSQNVYGKPANDFTYTKPKVQINIDEQYQKFFKQKSNTHFEDIRLHEEPQFRAMSEKQRIRRRFKEVYTDLNLNWKMQFSKSYNQVLDDQIGQKNSYEAQVKETKQKYKKRFSEQGIKKEVKYIKIGGVVVALISLPFILGTATKIHRDREMRDQYEQKMLEVFGEMQQQKLKSRMKYG